MFTSVALETQLQVLRAKLHVGRCLHKLDHLVLLKTQGWLLALHIFQIASSTQTTPEVLAMLLPVLMVWRYAVPLVALSAL